MGLVVEEEEEEEEEEGDLRAEGRGDGVEVELDAAVMHLLTTSNQYHEPVDLLGAGLRTGICRPLPGSCELLTHCD